MGGDEQDIVEGQRFLNCAHNKTPGRKVALYAPVHGRQMRRRSKRIAQRHAGRAGLI
jgi:hypothetical protein